MNDSAYFIAGAAVLSALLLSLWNVGPRSGGRSWALAWLMLFAAGGAAFVAGELLLARLAFPFLGTLFVGLLADGMLRFAGHVVPAWLWPVALAVGVLRGGLQLVLPDVVTQFTGTLLIVAGCGWCVWIFGHSDFARRHRAERLLAPLLLLPGLAQALYAWWRWQGIDPASGLFTWLMVGMIVAAFQVVLLLGRASERRTREALQQAQSSWVQQRSETAQVLAGGFAHVLNNRLQPIIGYTELLAARGNISVDEGEMLDRIRDATRRCVEVTHQAMDYSSPLELRPERITIEQLLAPLLGVQPVGLTLDPSCGAWLEVDVQRSREAIVQVLVNAREAGATSVLVSSRLDGYYRLLVITDDGNGIRDIIRDRMFEPFATTKMPTAGAGLGLALTRSVVVAHGGYVGTLPATAGATLVLAFPAIASELPGRHVSTAAAGFPEHGITADPPGR